MSSRNRFAGGAVAGTVCLAVIAGALIWAGCTSITRRDAARAAAAATAPALAARYLGVYEPGTPGSYDQVGSFASATGTEPGIVVYYSVWGESFAAAFASQAQGRGATVLVQLKPEHGAVGAVADGREDAYLRSYAQQVRSFGHQVIISFGQEMNGPWYSWGQGHVPPSLFVAAWRHMVTLFRAQGATNVTWLWDVNCELGKPLPVAPWWPGSAYVTWAGLDCYYSQPSDTFSSIFGPTIAAIRKVTSKPVLIAETAAGPDSGKQREAQIRGLFAGMEADHLLGFVWFDEKQDDGPYHQDWRLEDDPAALAVFKAAAKQYG